MHQHSSALERKWNRQFTRPIFPMGTKNTVWRVTINTGPGTRGPGTQGPEDPRTRGPEDWGPEEQGPNDRALLHLAFMTEMQLVSMF